MDFKYLIGIDEVGRGPIAGPLTFCALKVLSLKNFNAYKGLKDSKQLTPEEREVWFEKIKKEKAEGKLDFAISHIASHVVDRIGLSKAIKISIKRCLNKLHAMPNECLILLDGGLKAPQNFLNQRTIIKGDEKIKVIGMASIVAKVNRDRRMVKLSKKYAFYGFEKHKGYGTREHYAQIHKHGLSVIHRRSFLKKLLVKKAVSV